MDSFGDDDLEDGPYIESFDDDNDDDDDDDDFSSFRKSSLARIIDDSN